MSGMNYGAMPAAQRNNFVYTIRPDLSRVGILLLAGTWLLAIGLLNLFYAISVIAGSEIFITKAAWLVGDLRPWGGLMLVVSLVQLVAAGGVLAGRRWAIWIGVLSVLANIAAQLMFISEVAAPAILLLGLDGMVLWSLVLLMPERSRT